MARLTTRQKESKKASRSKAQRKRLRSIRFYTVTGLGALAAIMTAVASWWLVDSGWVNATVNKAHQAWHEGVADAGFGLQDLYIKGREKTTPEAVLAATGMRIGESIFSVPLDEIQARLETLGTVRRAMVERSLPGTLRITLEERQPIAVWQHHGKQQLVDIDGVVLQEQAGDYPQLLVVVGTGAPEHLAELLAMLEQEPELARQVVAAVRVGERRWDIKFTGGMEVMLPDAKQDKAWHKLADMQRRQDILDKAVRAIDMRIEERIFIKLPHQDTLPASVSQEGASET